MNWLKRMLGHAFINDSLSQLCLGFAVSFTLTSMIILTSRLWALEENPNTNIQNNHTGYVPRIGGIGILAGLWSPVFVMKLMATLMTDSIVVPLGIAAPLNSAQAVDFLFTPLVTYTLICTSLIFGIGFLEDLIQGIGVRTRLMLTFVPGMILAFRTGISLNHIGVPLIDTLLFNPWAAILFTGFALSGVAHAFNMTDGLNGLASYMSLWILGGFLGLAIFYSDPLFAGLCLLLIAPLLGFLILNWPWGKCFLGDGGAYLLGFYIAWLGVLLVERHPEVSPFAPLLLCAFPIIEALFTIARRLAQGFNIGKPDAIHFHQLFKSTLISPLFNDVPISIKSNSIAGFLIGLINLPLVVAAYFFNTNQTVLVGLFLLACAFYACAYYSLAHKTGDPVFISKWRKFKLF